MAGKHENDEKEQANSLTNAEKGQKENHDEREAVSKLKCNRGLAISL
jgi:hypothetical protein